MVHKSYIRIVVGIVILAAFGYSSYRLWHSVQREVSEVDNIHIDQMYEKDNIVPVAIVGSGPAGFAAAMYAARGALHTVVFEGNMPGGQLMTTSWVENWPAVDKKLGSDIMHDAREQARTFGAHMVQESITSVDTSAWPYKLTTESGQQIHALTVIWATGATPRMLGVPGEQLYWGKGVTTCAVCDAPFHKGDRVCVVGGGDSAVEEALELAPYASEIIIMVRRDVMRASPIMQRQLEAYDHIAVWYNTQISEIQGDDEHVTQVVVTRNGQKDTVPLEGVFLAIGHDPNTQLMQDHVATDERGYIYVYGKSQRTSRSGIYAAGDVEDDTYKQAGVAAGSGIKAALDAADFLRDVGYNEQIEKRVKDKLYDPVIEARRAPLEEITTVDEFKRNVLQADKPVIVDFYSQFCVTCHQMMPDIERLAARFSDHIVVYKVDALRASSVAKMAGVHGVPRIQVYQNGENIREVTQALSSSELNRLAEDVISA